MYIIVGLGNPGREYVGTRHNIGFEVADAICSKYDISLNKEKFRAIFGDGRIGGEKVIVAKPQTYMNLSGESIREIADWYKIEDEHIIIIYDDISKGSLEKVHCRKACLFEDDSYINQVGECDVIFAFTKDVMLKYYENKLCEISEQLHVRSKELNESMKAIENQKRILYTNSEKLFKVI